MRPILTYGFVSWSNISASQMERIRKAERTCIRTCINARRQFVNGSWILTSNRRLYLDSKIPRIDRVLVDRAIKYLTKSFAECPTLERCLTYTNTDTDIFFTSLEYKPPFYLAHLHDNNTLYTNELLLTYHQRKYNSTNTGLVYNTSQ